MADDSKATDKPVDTLVATTAPPRHSEWRRMARVFFGRKLYAIGFAICVILILIAIFAPWVATHDPLKTDLRHKLEQPSKEHWLGTDATGRDTYSRIIYGARTSLLIGFSAVFSSAIIGTLMGLAAAHFGGWTFAIIMRFTDAIMALPGIILVLLISGLAGGGIPIVIFALGFGGIAGMCRMMCGQALSVKQNDYVLAGRAIGMSNWRMMLTQIFPNAFPPLMVGITMGIGGVVLGEAGLSFLGIGVMPPTPSWGGMVNNGQSYLLSNPILSLAPGVAIMLLVFGFNMLGDGVRDAVDPKLRGVI
jgi:ABC-type dipeptide/oligopeptide/nickel transport system permease subunit